MTAHLKVLVQADGAGPSGRAGEPRLKALNGGFADFSSYGSGEGLAAFRASCFWRGTKMKVSCPPNCPDFTPQREVTHCAAGCGRRVPLGCSRGVGLHQESG